MVGNKGRGGLMDYGGQLWVLWWLGVVWWDTPEDIPLNHTQCCKPLYVNKKYNNKVYIVMILYIHTLWDDYIYLFTRFIT